MAGAQASYVYGSRLRCQICADVTQLKTATDRQDKPPARSNGTTKAMFVQKPRYGRGRPTNMQAPAQMPLLTLPCTRSAKMRAGLTHELCLLRGSGMAGRYDSATTPGGCHSEESESTHRAVLRCAHTEPFARTLLLDISGGCHADDA